jgi:hypothetical protein
MKTFGRILLIVVVFAVLAGIIAYTDGAMLPVQHTASVSGVVEAPPDKVFALIVNVGGGPSWRHSVQSVQVLPPDDGRDHWIENLGHGETMDFLAVRSEPVDASGHGRRDVRLNEPSASYGGTWTYELSPGASPKQTTLRITENGFIHPPIYRFMMVHVFGMTRNLDQYLTDIKAAATKD